MDSLVASIAWKERRHLRVLQVDVDERPDLAGRFRVENVPTLLLVKQRRVVERIEGRISAALLGHAIKSHLSGNQPARAVEDGEQLQRDEARAV
jgi:thioredoxin-like negative regulator of GroEL